MQRARRSWWTQLSFPHFGAHFDGTFTATDWNSMDDAQRAEVLMCFRIAYLADSEVNWCPALGTVLANDEVKDGLSERGGHPVVKKTMRQWMMRITAYADRLLESLDTLDWTDSVKEAQRHWIGRSEGAVVRFALANDQGQPDASGAEVEVFTTALTPFTECPSWSSRRNTAWSTNSLQTPSALKFKRTSRRRA